MSKGCWPQVRVPPVWQQRVYEKSAELHGAVMLWEAEGVFRKVGRAGFDTLIAFGELKITNRV